MMRKYDRVEKVLELYPRAREDKDWCYCQYGVFSKKITPDEMQTLYTLLKKVGDFEGVRRARQIVQNRNRPELGPSARIAKLQNELEARAVVTRGMSVANDEAWTPPNHLTI